MELRKGWNFKNDIAIPMEHKMRAVFGDEKYYHYADEIEGGELINCFEMVLLEKAAQAGNTNIITEINKFISDCEQYRNKGAHSINDIDAQKMYNKFLEIYKSLS